MIRAIGFLMAVALLISLCGCAIGGGEATTTLPTDTTGATEPATTAPEILKPELIEVTDKIPEHDIRSEESFVLFSEENEDVYSAMYLHNRYGDPWDSARFTYSDRAYTVCIDGMKWNQGNRYAAYAIENGQIEALESKLFSRSYALFGRTYEVEFEYALYDGQVILTYTDPHKYDDISVGERLGDNKLLLTFANSVPEENRTQTHKLILDVTTGELTNPLEGVDPSFQEQIVNLCIHQIKYWDEGKCFLGYTGSEYIFVDMQREVICNLNELTEMDHGQASVEGDSILWWSWEKDSGMDFLKINLADFSIKPLLEDIDTSYFSGGFFIVYEQDGETYLYDFLSETNQRIELPSIWPSGTIIPNSPDGRKALKVKENKDQRGLWDLLIFDYDELSVLHIMRFNPNVPEGENVSYIDDCNFEWSGNDKIIITSGDVTVYTIK